MLYDEEDCRVEDWDEPLALECGEKKSFTRASLTGLFNPYKNEAESVSVKAGAKLAVYDDSNYEDDEHIFTADA